MRLEVLSTRLFPRFAGASAYQLSGLAARCDWVVLTDARPLFVNLVRQNSERSPAHIFLSMRSPFHALGYFAEHVLPMLTAPFVLVSGSEDATVPNQIDSRWRPYNDAERAQIRRIIAHPLLLHWFAENLQDASHPLMSPLPLGLVFPEQPPAGGIEIPDAPPLAGRPPRALCAHRMRAGPQWDSRRQVSATARKHWADRCTILEDEVSEAEFFDLVEHHAFVICVPGGGVDPCPKAWECLLRKAIPIIRSGPLDAVYRELPVFIVPDWSPANITPAALCGWLARLAPIQDEPDSRAAVLEKLGLDYWWRKIEAVAETGRSAHASS